MKPLQPKDPEWVGDHQLLGRLGAGGMGVVYLGRSPDGQLVAVKVIRDRYANNFEYRARFRREIAAASEVTGAFTAEVLDSAPENAAPWLVTTYLPGLSLREAVRIFGAMPPAAVRALAAGLAEALAAIHGAGVVHRDLKPENVMLTAGGPRVIDFGIARPEDATAITRVGMTVGTPGFMSPEQVAGEAIEFASDVFTLGAVLVFAATGKEAFGSGSTEAKLRRVELVQADLSGITDDRLYTVITACLRRKPKQRPPAAGLLDLLGHGTVSLLGTRWLPAAVAQEVDRRAGHAHPSPPSPMVPAESATPGEPVAGSSVAGSSVAQDPVMGAATADPVAAATTDAGPAFDPAADERTTRDGARRLSRRTLVGGAAGVGVLAAGGVGGLWLSQRSNPSVTTGSSAPSRSPTGPPPQPTLRWKVQVSAYYPDLAVAGGAVVAWSDDRVHALDPHTGRVLWARAAERGTAAGDLVYVVENTIRATGVTVRPWELPAVRAASGAVAWRYRPGPDYVDFDYDHDYPLRGPVVTASLAFFGHGRVQAVSVAGGQPRWSAKVSAENGLAAGGAVVAAIGTAMVGLDAGSGRKKWTYPLTEGHSPVVGDGLVFACDKGGTLHAVRAHNGTLAWQYRTGTWNYGLQHGGGMLFTAGAGGAVLAFQAATGELVWSRRSRRDGGDLAWPNMLGLSGRTLYIASEDRMVHALDANDGRLLWTYGAQVARTSPPVTAAGLVFVSGKDGYVLALSPPGGGIRGGD